MLDSGSGSDSVALHHVVLGALAGMHQKTHIVVAAHDGYLLA
ncbi:MAG: hypothetical protein ACXWCY_09095 [Burkholderiales bacterium]